MMPDLGITSPQNTKKLREILDPHEVWFTDQELSRFLQLSSCIVSKAVVRGFLGIQQKARKRNPPDVDSALWARNQLNRFEAGFLEVKT